LTISSPIKHKRRLDMSDPPPNPPPPDDPEKVRSQHISARVPDHVGRGAFSTGAIVMTGANEFVLDFIQNVGRPHQITARVVMPHKVLPQFIDALRKNLELYQQRFGAPPELPRPSQAQRPSVQQIYDDLKLPDELLSGNYANGVMIGHSAAEFSFDFLTNFYPHSAVSCRVFLSAGQVPRLLESLATTDRQFRERLKKQQREDESPGQDPEPPAPADPEAN
jgi:hypothetical protein